MIKNVFLTIIFSTVLLAGCQGDRITELENKVEYQEKLIKNNIEDNERFGVSILGIASLMQELDQRLTKLEDDSKKGCRIR